MEEGKEGRREEGEERGWESGLATTNSIFALTQGRRRRKGEGEERGEGEKWQGVEGEGRWGGREGGGGEGVHLLHHTKRRERRARKERRENAKNAEDAVRPQAWCATHPLLSLSFTFILPVKYINNIHKIHLIFSLFSLPLPSLSIFYKIMVNLFVYKFITFSSFSTIYFIT